MNVKNKLQELKKKVSSNLIWPELGDLFNELQETYGLLQDKDKKEERRIVREIEEAISAKILRDVGQLEKETELQEVVMIFLYQWSNRLKLFEKHWAEVEKSINEANFLDNEEKQETIKQMKEDIERFKKCKSRLEKLLQKYNKQVQENSPPTEEDEANESKPEVASTNSSTGEKKGKKNKKGKGFPTWGIILIVLGILVAIGIAGYFILAKKEQNQKKKGK